MVLALIATACDRPADGPATADAVETTHVTLSSGASLELPLGGARALGDPTEDRFVWELDDGTRVTLQSAARPRMPGGATPDLAAVGEAMVTRFTMGDADGTLTHHPCTVGADTLAECIDASQTTAEGDHWFRRGAVFELGDQRVWLDAAHADASRAAEHADPILAGLVTEAAR
jgi:hypothetical protein